MNEIEAGYHTCVARPEEKNTSYLHSFAKNDTFCTFQLWFQIAVICKFVIFYIENIPEEIFYIGFDNHTIY